MSTFWILWIDSVWSILCVYLKRHFLFQGDNILAVLKYLLMSEKLADSSEYRHGNMVFFDVLGVVVVAYPARVGTILNYVVAAATFLYLAKKASLPGNGGRVAFPVLDVSQAFSIFCVFTSFPFFIFQISGVWVLNNNSFIDRLPSIIISSLCKGAATFGTWPVPQAWCCWAGSSRWCPCWLWLWSSPSWAAPCFGTRTSTLPSACMEPQQQERWSSSTRWPRTCITGWAILFILMEVTQRRAANTGRYCGSLKLKKCLFDGWGRIQLVIWLFYFTFQNLQDE